MEKVLSIDQLDNVWGNVFQITHNFKSYIESIHIRPIFADVSKKANEKAIYLFRLFINL